MDGNDWMKDLRSKAEHYQEPEPDGLWQDILASVRRRHYALWRRSLVAVSSLAAMAAAVLAFLYFLSHTYPSAPDAVSPSDGIHILGQGGRYYADVTGQPEKTPDAEIESFSADYPADSSTDHLLSGHVCGPVSDSPSDPSSGPSSGSPADPSSGSSTDYSSSEGQTSQPDPQVHEGSSTSGWPGNVWEDPVRQSGNAGQSVPSGSRRGNISAKVYYSNLTGSSSGGSGFGSLISPAAALDMDQAMSVVNAGDVNGSALMAVDDQLSTEVRHRQPVRAGVSVRFDLPGRWGIETGLTYSLLESESDAGTSYRYFHTRRRLHYLGIPVKVTFDAVRKRHWSLYVSAGGMLEKNIAGEADMDLIVDDVSVSTRKDAVLVKQLQWSLNAAAGAEYRIIPAIGLYAEPGVSWFIDNGSPIETVYQSRPVNFNLEMGLRFHF